MLLVLIALAAAAGAFALYLFVERAGPPGVPLALLRAGVWSLVAALLVNPGCRREDRAATTVLLDASASMLDHAGDARWRASLDSARAHAGANGRILLFGEQPRPWTGNATPGDRSSRLLPALRQAAGFGGPLVVVTDGSIDDAGALPGDLLRASRVVLVPRPDNVDAAVAAIDLPAALRAGDTTAAVIDVMARGAVMSDSALLELLEQGRVVARARIPLGTGSVRRSLSFVPAPATGQSAVRRYEARLTQFARDEDPRNDRQSTAAAVSSASSVVILSDAPDYDSRWLATTIAATSGLPVRSFVRLGEGGWRDTRTLAAAGDATVRDQAARAAVLVVHGTAQAQQQFGAASRGALWLWPATGEGAGDWYAAAPDQASPVGDALAGVPVESLPPLESAREIRADSVNWTGMVVQLNRRGRGVPVLQGAVRGNRRVVTMGGAGLWRWAARGGVALEGYRALVASVTDWLVETPGASQSPLLLAQRDSLARDTREFLPREATLAAQDGERVLGTSWAAPLRYSPWLYLLVVVALVTEWVARRRMGLR